MTNLRLELLGGFQLSIGGHRSSDPQAKKARALLAYLVLQDGRVVSRDQLAALLWAHSDHQRARHSLSQALSSVRRVFDGATIDGLEIAREHVRLDPSAVDVDAHAFTALAPSRELQSLERAAVLYKGDLLDGLHINEPGFQAWLCAEQERINEIAVAVLTAASEAQAKKGRLDDAIITALKLLALNSLHEQTHRALMRLYARQGRTDASLRQFKTLEQLLHRELATEPEAETRRLFQSITQNRTREPARPQFAHAEIPYADVRPSIVVLPFIDYSDDRDPDHFAYGLTDDLITDLSRINRALVIARNTAFTYKTRKASAHKIATELGVRYVVEGSVRRSGNQVRVVVRLVDGKTNIQVWTDRFDRDIEEVFLLQNEITGRIAASLRLELLQIESRRMQQGPPANLSAWGYAVRGWSELWTKPIRRNSTLEAKRLFERALELDSSLSLAWTGMARIQFIAALYPFGIGERVEAFRRALEAAENAVALDPTSPEAFVELSAALKTQFRFGEAESACQTAIALNPNYEEAYSNFAMLKQATGEPNEALLLFEHSFLLAPHLPTDGRRAFFVAQTHFLAGDVEQAVVYANKSIIADNKFPGGRWVRASVLGWQGRSDLAEIALAELSERDEGLNTIEKVSRQYRYIANMDRAFEGLRRAGMPEK